MSHSVQSTLWDLKRGESAIISAFEASLDEAIKDRIEELGFHLDSRVYCTQAPRLGAPKLYRVGNAVYSLEKQIAQLVVIQRTDGK